MRGEVIILVNFPISHFLQGLRHSAVASESLLSHNHVNLVAFIVNVVLNFD